MEASGSSIPTISRLERVYISARSFRWRNRFLGWKASERKDSSVNSILPRAESLRACSSLGRLRSRNATAIPASQKTAILNSSWEVDDEILRLHRLFALRVLRRNRSGHTPFGVQPPGSGRARLSGRHASDFPGNDGSGSRARRAFEWLEYTRHLG